eukprot:2392480-Rhodomonas_salina.1
MAQAYAARAPVYSPTDAEPGLAEQLAARAVAYPPTASYAMSGTDIAYGADPTRLLRDVRY